MVREPGAELVEAAREFVSVRVHDMSRIDLDVFEFDYDLTLAVLLMAADGHVYHRFGSRGAGDPTAYASLAVLAAVARATAVEHAARTPPAAREAAAPRCVVDLPPLQRRRAADARLAASCVHCHTVHDTLHAHAVEQGSFRPGDEFVYPQPERLGLTLDTGRQARVAAVAEGSAAAAAGLRPGDELLRLGMQQRVLTLADVQWALHRAPAAGGELQMTWRRDGREHHGALPLADGWKRAPPEEYAWRAYKWNLSPAPGLGGPVLGAAARRRLGLPAGGFAFRVQYLVDWGERAHRGRAAREAGVRRDDVVLSFAGKSDFRDMDHFHAWVRLTRAVGEEVEVVVLRDGERRTLRYRLPP